LSSEKRIEYGYAGMTREAAYKAYMGLTCNNPPVPLEEREDRIAVLKEIMAEEFAREIVVAD
jgi:hypothetical protein